MTKNLLCILFALGLAGQVNDQRLAEIRAKHQRGEKITEEERDYYESSVELKNQTESAKRNLPWAKEHPARASTGLVPLTDLGKGMYKGEQGGLYPGGMNTPPAAHLQAGLRLAAQIVPLDREGHKSASGRIVLCTIGMSNTTQESRSFIKLFAKDPILNPTFLFVDCAQGAQTASKIQDPNFPYWQTVMARLKDAEVTPRQVQVVWLKEANPMPTAPFLEHTKEMQGQLVKVLHNLHDKFPNLKIAYLSSRIYGGWAGAPLNPEPWAYEEGFSYKWLIADQIAGNPELNYDPAKGAVRSPWIEWGPYLWADGLKGRKDGLVWKREDVGPDGTHPSMLGREKVARLLMEFLKKDPTSQPWFLKAGVPMGGLLQDPRFQEIKAKHERGEKITEEERDYRESLIELGVQAAAVKREVAYQQAHPIRESIGQIPLTDLGKGKYQGEEGGLYPGGVNTPPKAHLEAGLRLAAQIVPLDRDGHKSDSGRIVLCTIGMSNTTMASRSFLKLAAAEPGLNPTLTLVDGAMGSQTASKIKDPNFPYWKVVSERLANAGVTPQQVQVVWLKEANPSPKEAFPIEAKRLQQDIVAVLHNLHDKFPNLKIVYVSARIYGGYAMTQLNPEPHAYESGFSVKWLIADQIAGKPELNYDPAKGAVRSPYLIWGPYFWADGMKPRKDGLIWTREDLCADGTHPSVQGREKVARLLIDFFKKDSTSRTWFIAAERL